MTSVDEISAILDNLVGQSVSSETSDLITESEIINFATALEEKNFSFALPTFGITLSALQHQYLLKDSGLNWDRSVHGEQAFEIFKPITAGISLRCESRVESARQTSRNVIVLVRSDLLSGSELIVSGWRTSVFRK